MGGRREALAQRSRARCDNESDVSPSHFIIHEKKKKTGRPLASGDIFKKEQRLLLLMLTHVFSRGKSAISWRARNVNLHVKLATMTGAEAISESSKRTVCDTVPGPPQSSTRGSV